MKEEMAKKKKKQISLKEINDKDIQDLYIILKKSNKERKKKDTVDIFLFLLKTKIKDFLKSDLLYTEYTLDILYNFINPYISGDIFHSGEMIYSYGEEAENIYIILKGCIGQYKLVESKELLACEDYYSYLSDKFQHFKKTMIEQSDDNKSIYINEKEYIDIHLLRKMVSINKDIFPLYSFDDIEDLKKIVLGIKIYTKLLENKTAEINDMFQKFNFPLSFLNYDKFLNNDITIFNYIKYLSKRIQQREQFYMKFLGKTTEYKVKLMKYVKVEVLKPYDYFGNFEMIDTKPFRNDAARC
jgi:CRP-like cAMP-binding protein